MDPGLAFCVDAATPKINPLLGNGIATEHMKHTESYIDQVFRSVAKSFPANLIYNGFVRCTPMEEYRELTRPKPKSTFDIARSDIYMVKYLFTYEGEKIERFISLPFVGEAGSIYLGNSRFIISPILADRVISIGESNIFVRLLKARLTFERMSQHYMADGKRETVRVPWSTIYNKNAKQRKIKPLVKANCTLVHYLFCKYGFTETFIRFGNCHPVVGNIEKVNRNTYPENEWMICQSTQIAPKGCGRGFYQPTTIQIAIRRSEVTPIVQSMIGGFFYVVDHFPGHILPEYVESRELWMVMMGHIIFSGSIHRGKLLDDIKDHIESLDDYIDAITLIEMKEIGMRITDVYELFAAIIQNYNDWLLGGADKINSMYEKKISVIGFVLFEIVKAIINCSFKLKAGSKKKMTKKEVINIMNSTLRTGLIYSINKNHPEVTTTSYSGDNKAFKITSLLVPQSGANKQGGRKDRTVLKDPTKYLHVSVAEVGGYSNLPKSAPDGRSKLNINLRLDENGVVIQDPKFVPLMTDAQEKIKR